jgi:hypothetical protein
MSLTQLPARSDAYIAGACNIGPAEVTARRRFGHLALAVSLALLAGLVIVHAPAWSRLILFFTVSGSASGYIQARSRFCANFGSRGVYNFGPLGTVERVAGDGDRVRDRARALRIMLESAAIGLVAAVAAFLLPF